MDIDITKSSIAVLLIMAIIISVLGTLSVINAISDHTRTALNWAPILTAGFFFVLALEGYWQKLDKQLDEEKATRKPSKIKPEYILPAITLSLAILALGMFTILAVSVFVWPLYGVHRLMEMEKERVLHDIDLRLEAVFSKFNQRFREDDYSAIEMLNGTIASLEIQHRKIEGIPTWPWRPETARSVLTAIALPLVLRIVQFLVEQVFDW